LLELTPVLGGVWSTSPVDESFTLNDPWTSHGHTVIDLGDDLFTRGRPHPMIDHGLRNERIVKEAGDPSTAVVLLDVVLGHGADMDPANVMLPAIAEARELARSGNRRIDFVASVCGTGRDPQNLDRQEAALRDAGVRLAPSNVQAARLAAKVLAETAGGGS
ncbi:MAG: transcriptional regulator, partial [Rhodospirillales bacterium]|nr:transcriptional regulator [Rhodospirillales bacterium]